MLFATYGAPSPPKGKNPLVIILGVCGGCVLLVIIGVVIMVFAGANMFKGIIGGAVQTPETTRKFVTAIENHDYTSAAAQVEPSAQGTFNAAKIRSVEEQVEKKLGPVQPGPVTPAGPASNTIPGPNGKPQYMEYVYSIPIRYKKGTAIAAIHFRSDDLSGLSDMRDISKIKIPGKLTSFKITPDTE
jgi:hypothetical protein